MQEHRTSAVLLIMHVVGLYPPFDDTVLLANGSAITWSRTQLIQVETIEADQQVWLEGWTSCDAWQTRLR